MKKKHKGYENQKKLKKQGIRIVKKGTVKKDYYSVGFIITERLYIDIKQDFKLHFFLPKS